MERSKVIERLRLGITRVEFTKVNGEVRVMQCTLNPALLPEQVDLEEHVQKKAPNPDVCAVFDTENRGWRSFRWDSLLNVDHEVYIV